MGFVCSSRGEPKATICIKDKIGYNSTFDQMLSRHKANEITESLLLQSGAVLWTVLCLILIDCYFVSCLIGLPLCTWIYIVEQRKYMWH